MNRWYDIFEVLPDGTLEWRISVDGFEPAIQKMQELSAEKTNEFRMVHLPTQEIAHVIKAKNT